MYKDFIFDHCSEKLSSQFPISILKCPWGGTVREAVKLCSCMGGEEFQNTGKKWKNTGQQRQLNKTQSGGEESQDIMEKIFHLQI